MAECNSSGQKYLQTVLTSAYQVTLLFPPTLHVISLHGYALALVL